MIPMMRFQENQNQEKNDNNEDPDGLDAIDIKFSDDKSFFEKTTKDRELNRREGLSNGLILVNGKRTLNTEISEYSQLYYDLFEN